MHASYTRPMSGDADAFVREHASLVCGVVLGIVSDVRASEEIAQDVFLHAWRGLHRLRNPAGLRAWLR